MRGAQQLLAQQRHAAVARLVRDDASARHDERAARHVPRLEEEVARQRLGARHVGARLRCADQPWRRLAERVREELLATVFQTELGRLKVTASIGVATFPDHAVSEKGLFEASDKALYVAKHGGRNQVQAA